MEERVGGGRTLEDEGEEVGGDEDVGVVLGFEEGELGAVDEDSDVG